MTMGYTVLFPEFESLHAKISMGYFLQLRVNEAKPVHAPTTQSLKKPLKRAHIPLPLPQCWRIAAIHGH